MKKKYVNIMSKLDEETARRLDRIREKFGFASCYEIMQCLISAFLRYADPGGEPYAQLDQSVVHLSHIFEGLENDLTRAAVGKPGARGGLRLDDIIAIYSVQGHRKRTIRHYTIKPDDSVSSSVNEGAALDEVLAAVSPRVTRELRRDVRESGCASTVDWLTQVLRERRAGLGDDVAQDVREEMSAMTDAELPLYGERSRRTKGRSVNDAGR